MMAGTAAHIERRRATRVLMRVPVTLFSSTAEGSPVHAPGEAVAVSRFGALLRAPIAPSPGSRIDVLHGLSQEVREFRVVRIGEGREGLYDLGVEMILPGEDFWGSEFSAHPKPA